MKKLFWTLVALGALLCAAIGAGVAGAAAPTAYTCTGGTIPAGTYSSLTVKGNCTLGAMDMTKLDGTVHVLGNMTVAKNASLNAVTGTNLVVNGNVTVGKGAIVGIGCSPAIGCTVTTSDRIGGNLTANGAAMVIVHSTRIGGNVSQRGGGGNMRCDVMSPLMFPYYSDYEDNTIGGNVSVSGLKTCWFGFIRNTTGGNVSLHNNKFGDPDADEIVTNVIHGNLSCSGNYAPPQIGDAGVGPVGNPNTVSGNRTGQCAYIPLMSVPE